MTIIRKTKINITEKGDVIVKDADLIIEHDDVVVIELNTKTKWCEITRHDFNDYPAIGLIDVSDDLHDETEVEFPEYAEWDICSATEKKNYIAICLTKRK